MFGQYAAIYFLGVEIRWFYPVELGSGVRSFVDCDVSVIGERFVYDNFRRDINQNTGGEF